MAQREHLANVGKAAHLASTAAGRPAAAADNAGVLHVATDTLALSYSDGSSWLALGGSAFVQTIGDGSSTTIDVTHGLGTRALGVSVQGTASPFEEVYPHVEFPSLNVMRLIFDVAPGVGALVVTLLGKGGSAPSVAAHASSHSPGGSDPINVSAVGAVMHLSGLAAARPAASAGNANYQYTATDTGVMSFSTGSVWVDIVSAINTSTDVQTFATAGGFTWTKPTGAKMVQVILLGGGGGGGGGLSTGYGGSPAGYQATGGGGGQVRTFATAATVFGATESVTVGAGGTAGTGATASPGGGDSIGTVGGSGGNSSFSSLGMVALGGGAGSFGAPGYSTPAYALGGGNGLEGAGGGSGLAALGGGGAGGGLGGFIVNGVNGAKGTSNTGGGTGGTTGASPTAGGAGQSAPSPYAGGGGGGGGGTSAASVNGAVGGAGGPGSGGGGGGAAYRPSQTTAIGAGGNGGVGGAGTVIVVTYR